MDEESAPASAEMTDQGSTAFAETTEQEKGVATEGEAPSSTTSNDATQKEPPRPAPLDWDGPNDPDNPLNWSLRKKAYHTASPALFAFVVTFASSVYSPGFPEVMERFHVGSTTALLGLSLYVLGLAFGPVLAAPLSETHGRRPVYMLTLPIFALFTLGSGFAQNFATLCICRFFAGFFGSPPLAVGAGTMNDLYPREIAAISVAFYILSPFFGPAIGPVVGGFAAENKGWRWTMWCTLFITVAFYTFALGMQETYKKSIILTRAKKRGQPVPPSPPLKAFLKVLLTVTLFRPIHMLITEPIVAFLSLYISFNFAVLYTFISAFSLIFQTTYGFDTGKVGLVFISIGIGCLLGTTTVIAIDRTVYVRQVHRYKLENRQPPPEHRLYAALGATVGLPIGLFWFAWTARPDIHWAVPVAAAIPFAWGNLCLFTTAAMYLSDVYGALYGASALAANSFLRYILGAAFPLFAIQMYENLGTGWATSLLGFITVGLLPVPWVLWKWGPQIRARSSYDVTKY